MADKQFESLNFSDMGSLADSFARADRAGRAVILEKFVEQNPNKVAFFFKARNLARQLESRASYTLLKEYENAVARLKYPGRKRHMFAGFFTGKHYEEKARPYVQRIKQLKKEKNINTKTMLPIITEMVETEGYELARDYFDRVSTGIESDDIIKKAIGPISEIESALAKIGDGIGGNPVNKAELKRDWKIIQAHFDQLFDRDLGPLFVTRAKNNAVMNKYGAVLDSYLEFKNRTSQKTRAPDSDRPHGGGTDSGPRINTDSKPVLEESLSEQTVAVSARKPTAAIRTGGRRIKKKDLLLRAIVDVFKIMPTHEMGEVWLGYIEKEPLVSEAERQELELMIDEARLLAGLDGTEMAGSEARKNKIEKYMTRLASDLTSAEEVSIKLELINRYRNFKSNSIIEKVKTIYEILSDRVGTSGPLKTPDLVESGTGSVDAETENTPVDSPDSIEDFLDDAGENLDEMAAFFEEEQKSISGSVDDILQTEDPEAGFDRALEAYGSELFAEYLEPLRGMLNLPAGFGDFIRNLETGPMKGMAPWELRSFLDGIITAVQNDAHISAAHPMLAQRLTNYRNNMLAQPSLLETVFNNLRKIKESYPFDAERALREQIKYLTARLKDEDFKPVRSSIMRIYRNALLSVVDTSIMDDIAAEPAWKQVMILSSLKQCYSGMPREAAKIERMLQDARLADMMEKIESGAASNVLAAEKDETSLVEGALKDLTNLLGTAPDSDTAGMDESLAPDNDVASRTVREAMEPVGKSSAGLPSSDKENEGNLDGLLSEAVDAFFVEDPGDNELGAMISDEATKAELADSLFVEDPGDNELGAMISDEATKAEVADPFFGDDLGDIESDSVTALEDSLESESFSRSGAADDLDGRKVEIDAELDVIHRAATGVLADIADNGKFHELGAALGESRYLSPEDQTAELFKIKERAAEEAGKSKFNDILEVSGRINMEIDPLDSLDRKTVNLQFWADNDYADLPHVNEFLKGQISEYEKEKQREGGLLERLFIELRKIADSGSKISFLEIKLADPEYRYLVVTIRNLIGDIQRKIDLEPEGISREWIDKELEELKDDPESQLDWLRRRRYLEAYRSYGDHIEMRMIGAQEQIGEKELRKCVATKLSTLKDGEKPEIFDSIEGLTRAVLERSGAGKRQQLIIEQESLKPLEKDSLLGKQRRLLFFLMSSTSDKPEARLKALADRRKLSISEKHEYLSLLNDALAEAGGAENFGLLLGMNHGMISYSAVHILAQDKPLTHRIRYIERFRDDQVNESCLAYKERLNLSPDDFNRVIVDLEKLRQVRETGSKQPVSSGIDNTETYPSPELNGSENPDDGGAPTVRGAPEGIGAPTVRGELEGLDAANGIGELEDIDSPTVSDAPVGQVHLGTEQVHVGIEQVSRRADNDQKTENKADAGSVRTDRFEEMQGEDLGPFDNQDLPGEDDWLAAGPEGQSEPAPSAPDPERQNVPARPPKTAAAGRSRAAAADVKIVSKSETKTGRKRETASARPAKRARSAARPVKKKAARPATSKKRKTPAKKAKKKAAPKAPMELNKFRQKILQDSSKIITKSMKRLISMSKKTDPVLFKNLFDLYLSPKSKRASLVNLLGHSKNKIIFDSIRKDDKLLARLTFDRKSVLKLYNKLK